MNKSNATKVYHDLLEDILKNGSKKNDRTGTGTVSVFGRQVRFNMKDGFPLLTTKKLHLRSITHELLWFLKGDTNIKYLNDNSVTIWDEWADDSGDLGSVYGKQWVDWGGTFETLIRRERDESGHFPFVKKHNPGINQINNVVELLKNDPDSRRMVVSAWNVGELEQMKLVPCHNFFQLYTRELSYDEKVHEARKRFGFELKDGTRAFDINTKESIKFIQSPQRELSLMWNQRSVDTFLGLPFNIASYAMLLHMFAQQVNMVPGELVGNLGDVHIYNNHIDYVEEQLGRDVYKHEQPELSLNKGKDMFSYKFEDFKVEGYDSYPNWKRVPISV
tara:strand:- start:6113 stop:7111 length:999 start_codon:yes stop_codon:yes gene_type:complete